MSNEPHGEHTRESVKFFGDKTLITHRRRAPNNIGQLPDSGLFDPPSDETTPSIAEQPGETDKGPQIYEYPAKTSFYAGLQVRGEPKLVSETGGQMIVVKRFDQGRRGPVFRVVRQEDLPAWEAFLKDNSLANPSLIVQRIGTKWK